MKSVYREKLNGCFITVNVADDKLYYDIAKESTGRKLLSGALDAKTTKITVLRETLRSYVQDVDNRNLKFNVSQLVAEK